MHNFAVYRDSQFQGVFCETCVGGFIAYKRYMQNQKGYLHTTLGNPIYIVYRRVSHDMEIDMLLCAKRYYRQTCVRTKSVPFDQNQLENKLKLYVMGFATLWFYYTMLYKLCFFY